MKDLKDNKEREIIRTIFDKNINVEAGAGTGKTHEMVTRIINGLERKIFTIDKIVIITYTKSAAAEMKGRIIQKLKEFSAKEKGSSDNNIFSIQLKKINNARISTVHSFCQALLKERPVEAGFDPHFEIIENNDEIVDEVLNILLEKTFSKNHKSSDKNYIEIGKLFKELLLENNYSINNEYGNNLQNLIQLLVQYRELALVNPIKLDFETENKAMLDLINEYISNFAPFPKLQEKISAIKPFFENLNDSNTEATITELNNLKVNEGNSGGKDAKELRDEWKEKYNTIKSRIIYALNYPELEIRFQRLQTLFSEVKEIYNELLIKKSCIDFTGILMQTRDLLKNNLEVREYFKNKYTHYFIDEFQDTDPLQAEIVSYLCCQKGETEKDWEKIEYEEGKLFIIGDPKQSIYKFGRADIAIYSKMCSRITKKVELTTNFRSEKNIINYVNNFFKDRIQKKEDYQPDYFSLNVRPNIDQKSNSKIIAVSSKIFNDNPENLKADEIRKKEAKLTVCKLLQAKNNNLFSKWSDVTVLFKHYTILPFLQKYLEGAGIPYWVSGGRSYFARPEIKDLLVLLKALADPTDSLSVLATLKGPFFGFSDKEIWLAKQKENWTFNYLKPIEEPENEIEEAFVEIKALHFKTYNEPPAHIINRIIYNPKYTTTLFNTYRGDEKLKNLFKAAEYVRHHGVTSFSEMVNTLDEAVKDKIEMGDLDLNADTGNSIKLMTIYKAKGLQNKVIYLCDTTSRETRNNSLIQSDKNLYFGFKNFQCITFPKIQAIDKEKNEAEVERLRYVVATRAENHFIFNNFPHNTNTKNKFISHFFNNLDKSVVQEEIDTDEFEFTDVYTSCKEIKPEYDASIEKEKNEWFKQYSDTKNKAEIFKYKKLSPSKLTDNILSEEDNIDIKFELKDNDYTGFYAVKSKSSDMLGNLIHKIMEHIETVQPNSINQFIQALIKEYNLSETVENILIIVNKIREHSVYQRALKAKEVHRELPIKFTDEDNNIYDGVIDLLFRENDKWILADYKISQKNENILKNKYEKQLRAYSYGLKQSGLCHDLDEIHIIPISFLTEKAQRTQSIL